MSEKRKKLSSINWEHYRPIFRKVFEKLVCENPWNEYNALYDRVKKSDAKLALARKESEAATTAWLAKTDRLDEEQNEWYKKVSTQLNKEGFSFEEHMLAMFIDQYEP